MKRRTFMKISSTAAAGAALTSLTGWKPDDQLTNWAGNIVYSTNKVYAPQSIDEMQQFVKKYDKLKVLGSRHCFNRIADSKDLFVSLKNFNKVVSLDTSSNTVTVEGGVRYGELAPYLHEKGYALHNLASLPHISVAGACATATHGSGMKNGSLATAVRAIEMVTADGSIVQLSQDKDGDQFLAAVVGLGAFGVTTKLTLAVQPTYTAHQHVFVNLPLKEIRDHFEEIMTAGYSVSLFTDWKNESINEVWIKSLSHAEKKFEPTELFFGAKAATKNLHPIAELDAENCTEQLGVDGPWFERLPHFKMGFTPSAGKELQSEYFVPLQHAVEAILAVQQLTKQISPYLLISEIRAIDADKFWMSPFRNQASVAIHFTWKQDWPAVRKLLPVIEETLSAYNVKPHWGKLFALNPKVLASRYEKLEDFKKVIAGFDPKGKFRNEFLNRNIYGIA